MTTKNEWIATGDVNPIEHGGVWTRKDGNGFQVITVNTVEDCETETWFVTDTYIDMSDYQNDGVIAKYVGYKDFTPADVVNYYGAYQLGGSYETIEGRETVEAWVKSYDIIF